MSLTLAQIVTTDPDNRGYPAMTDGQIEADIKDKRHSIRNQVSIPVFAQKLIDLGVMLNITQARLDPNHSAHATAVLVKEMLDEARNNGILDIDMDKTGNIALFNAMQSAGLMTASDAAAVSALADIPASLADIHHLKSFSHLDIAAITGGAN